MVRRTPLCDNCGDNNLSVPSKVLVFLLLGLVIFIAFFFTMYKTSNINQYIQLFVFLISSVFIFSMVVLFYLHYKDPKNK